MTRLSELIPLLIEKTAESKLQWDELSGTGKSFIATLGEWRLEVFRSGHETQLFLRNPAGQIIESTSYETLPPPYDQQLIQLQDMARRNALKVEDALETIKDSLFRL